MHVKGNEESMKHHLTGFYHMVEYYRAKDSQINIYSLADQYVKNEVSMEEGMQEYADWCAEVERRNKRLLRAIKSVKGRSFYRHVVAYLEEIGTSYYDQLEIVREPHGDEQSQNEYGRAITKEWINQWSTGVESDSYSGTACIQIKENRYLKISYSS